MKLRPLKAFALIILAMLLCPDLKAQMHLRDTVNARLFVQKFYNWYGPIYAKKRHADARIEVLKQKPRNLEKGLLNSILADYRAQSKTKLIVSLGFDPFTNSLDKRKGYQTDEAVQKDGSFFVDIHDIGPGRSTNAVRSAELVATAEVAKIAGNWVFINFFYPTGYGYGDGGDLLGKLDSLKKDRIKISNIFKE
jgi:hypothetical protein